MTAPTSEQRLEWARLSAAATRGPWEVYVGTDELYVNAEVYTNAGSFTVCAITDDGMDADAEFIASAREAVPALLAESEQLRARIAGVVDALLTGGQNATVRCQLAMQALAASVEVLS